MILISQLKILIGKAYLFYHNSSNEAIKNPAMPGFCVKRILILEEQPVQESVRKPLLETYSGYSSIG